MIWLPSKSFFTFFPQHLKPDVLGLDRQLTDRRKDRIILAISWCQTKISKWSTGVINSFVAIRDPALLNVHMVYLFSLRLVCSCPGWCGSVDWVLACEPKGYWFDSQSGHMPGLQARSPFGGMQETINWCISCMLMFLSLSISLPSPLPKSREIKSFKIRRKKKALDGVGQ